MTFGGWYDVSVSIIVLALSAGFLGLLIGVSANPFQNDPWLDFR